MPTCPVCDGSGECQDAWHRGHTLEDEMGSDDGHPTLLESIFFSCPSCGGTNIEEPDGDCENCGGTGEVDDD